MSGNLSENFCRPTCLWEHCSVPISPLVSSTRGVLQLLLFRISVSHLCPHHSCLSSPHSFHLLWYAVMITWQESPQKSLNWKIILIMLAFGYDCGVVSTINWLSLLWVIPLPRLNPEYMSEDTCLSKQAGSMVAFISLHFWLDVMRLSAWVSLFSSVMLEL